MLHPVILLALPVLVAVLHRIRGGGILPGLLPRLAWVAITTVVIITVCLLAGVWWPVAAILGATYGLWCIPGWMPELTAAEGAVVPADQVMSNSWDVRGIMWLSGGHPVLACYLRAALPLLPCAGLLMALDEVLQAGPVWSVALLGLIVIGFWPIYRFAYWLKPFAQSVIAEPMTGAIFGASVAGIAALS